jgi:shikimate kinase/3-dehydroquinate synthase
VQVRYAFEPSPHAPLPADLPGPGLIVLTGFMGTGKTRTGRALAEMLGADFADTDELIAAREGMTVEEIFARRGEPEFRRLEGGICRELAKRRGLVMATGGGTLLDEGNRAVLAGAGTVILLEASPEVILARVGEGRERPLLRDAQGPVERLARIVALLAERAPAYGRIALRVDTSAVDPRTAAARIAVLLDLPRHEIAIHGGGAHRDIVAGDDRGTEPVSRIVIGRGGLSGLGARLVAHGLGPRVFLFVASGLREIFLGQVTRSLEQAGLSWEVLAVEDGDAHKNLEQAAALIDRLAELGADRHATAVTVGGGVTGDLAGFVASIYMRGMPLVHAPTTLLAQVDASIGGKVAVNHPRAKNLIGSFHLPRLVVSDPSALRTLPRREIASGMAEVVKTAVLGSADLFSFLQDRLDDGPETALRDAALLERCVAECAAVKAAVVERDPFEAGERRVLNLGHTAGHALEAVGGYETVSHGEAVSMGLVIATRIAAERSLVSADLLRRVRRMLRRCGLPVAAPQVPREAFIASLSLDKKKRAGRLHFVLPAGLGVCQVVDDVTPDEVWGALEVERAERAERDERAGRDERGES